MALSFRNDLADGAIIVGLGYRKGVGKTHAAEYLRQAYDFQVLSFASPLKEIAARLPGYTGDKSQDRQLLQELGVAAREIIGERVWVDHLLARIDGLMAEGFTRFVVDDVRFPNEAEVLKHHGGFLIGIDAPTLESTDTHISERAVTLSDFHVRVENNYDQAFVRDLDEVLARQLLDWHYGQ